MWKRNKFVVQEEETGGEGSSGGSSSFLEEAAPAASPEPAETSTEADVNWAGIAEEFEAEEVVEGDLEIVKEEPEVLEEAAVVVPPEAPAEPAPITPTPTAATAPTEVIAQPSASPAEYQTWRATKVTELEQMYALDAASADAMLTEPELVLPKLAARVHMEVMESSMRAMQAMMPVMMQQVQQHTEVEGKAKNLFSSINPDLVQAQYMPAIMQLGKVYREVNPSAGPEEAARAIGALVRSALNITAAPAGTPPIAAQVAPPRASTFHSRTRVWWWRRSASLE